MKKSLLILSVATVLVSSCRKPEPVTVLSVCAFQPKADTKAPGLAEQICLKAFAATVYDPELEHQWISQDDLDKIGYPPRFWGNHELNQGSQKVFDQALPWDNNGMKLLVESQSEKNGTYTLKVNFSRGGQPLDPKTARFATVTGRSSGAIIFDNGLAVSWAAKAKK
ncbi:MAG: hypothetical protein ABIT37_21680 [Luteolibacter sp.]